MSDVLRLTDHSLTTYIGTADAFKRYEIATGATIDDSTGLLTITQDQYANLQILSFQIGSNVYDLSPNAQIWPRSLNIAIGGSSSKIYLVVNDIGNITGSGLDFINGYSFLYVLGRFSSAVVILSKCVSFFFFQRALLRHLRYHQPADRLGIHRLYQRDHQLESYRVIPSGATQMSF